MDEIFPQQDRERLEQCASSVGEHYDSVVIIVSRSEGGDTEMLSAVSGNGYAQTGSVKAWLRDIENSELAASFDNTDDDDGEVWKQSQ